MVVLDFVYFVGFEVLKEGTNFVEEICVQKDELRDTTVPIGCTLRSFQGANDGSASFCTSFF
jgi:hypothetical protein